MPNFSTQKQSIHICCRFCFLLFIFQTLSKMIFNFVSTVFKVALFTATPFKSLAVYRTYFDLSSQTSFAAGGNRNLKLIFLFRLLLAALLYLIALNLFNFCLPRALPLEGRLATFDTVHYFNFPAPFYLLFSLHCALVVNYLYCYYFRPSQLFNDHLRRALFSSEKTGPTTQSELFQKTLCSKVPPAERSTSAVAELIRRKATVITNHLEAFIAVSDFGVVIWFSKMGQWYVGHYFSLLSGSSSSSLTWKLTSPPVFLLHGALYLTYNYAFCYSIGFVMSYTFVSLSYLSLLIEESNRKVEGAISKRTESGKSLPKLVRSLRENVTIFRLLFAADAFHGNAFLAFLLINLPTNAMFTVLCVFQQMDAFLLFSAAIIVLQEVIGTVLLHVTFARFSRHAHGKVARLLVRFSAHQGGGGGGKGDDQGDDQGDKQKQNRTKVKKKKAGSVSFSVTRERVTVWAHTMRLLTVNQYGFTYGAIGAKVTIATFSKVRSFSFLSSLPKKLNVLMFLLAFSVCFSTPKCCCTLTR